MSISANELKYARHVARLTQAELAEKLGVSLRTVTNWESEGGGVPRRSTTMVAEVLNLRPTKSGKWVVAPDHDREEQNRESSIKPGLDRLLERFESEGQHGITDLAQVIKLSPRVVDFADAAARAGAHPLNVIRFLEATMGIVAETGGLGLPGSTSENLINDVLIRGVDVGMRAVENFGDLEREAHTINMGEVRARAEELGIRDVQELPENVVPGGRGEGSEDEEGRPFEGLGQQ